MKFGNRIEVDPDKLRINEEAVDYTAFGTSRYAKLISRTTDELIKMGYCITEENKSMNDLEKSRTLIKVYPNCAKRYLNNEYGISTSVCKRTRKSITIKDVIFNDPATIVFWSDDTKTVVKCQDGDIFDKEKGLAMAISKKFFGNKGSYYETFKTFCQDEKNEDSENVPTTLDVSMFTDFARSVNEVYKAKIDLLNRYMKHIADICNDED